jgi:hypothetical protein
LAAIALRVVVRARPIGAGDEDHHGSGSERIKKMKRAYCRRRSVFPSTIIALAARAAAPRRSERIEHLGNVFTTSGGHAAAFAHLRAAPSYSAHEEVLPSVTEPGSWRRRRRVVTVARGKPVSSSEPPGGCGLSARPRRAALPGFRSSRALVTR